MPKYQFSRTDCENWLANPNVNPKTNRPINPRTVKGVYQALLVQCEQFGLVPNNKSISSGTKILPSVKKADRIWTDLSREQVINLAKSVLDEEPKAIQKALEIHQVYCQKKKQNNDLFTQWQKTGEITKDQALALSAEFLGRFCRCIQEIKLKQAAQRTKLEQQLTKATTEAQKRSIKRQINDLSGVAFGSCQKSIYNNRKLKGVATRGLDKVECDDELAQAQNVIKQVGRC